MSVTKRQGGESSRIQTHLGVGESTIGRIVIGAIRPWGERYSGRNVLLPKRTVGLSPICTLSLSKDTQRSIAQIIFNESNYDIRRT